MRPLADFTSTSIDLHAIGLRPTAASVALLVLLAGCGDNTPTIHQAPAQKQLDQPIQHVFVIFKENHTYDNYFLSRTEHTSATASRPTPDAEIFLSWSTVLARYSAMRASRFAVLLKRAW